MDQGTETPGICFCNPVVLGEAALTSLLWEGGEAMSSKPVCAVLDAIRQLLKEPGLSDQQCQPRKCTAWAHWAPGDRESLVSPELLTSCSSRPDFLEVTA